MDSVIHMGYSLKRFDRLGSLTRCVQDVVETERCTRLRSRNIGNGDNVLTVVEAKLETLAITLRSPLYPTSPLQDFALVRLHGNQDQQRQVCSRRRNGIGGMRCNVPRGIVHHSPYRNDHIFPTTPMSLSIDATNSRMHETVIAPN